ncbi:MAG TPA: NAD(P)H-hydrate dehydratase [Thiobacillaceae bacterium]|nr:NAD(P)H-hydrate dehydratase [Thiobacillaceae bacterium]HNU63300.1 NAD(P)H-hydrate dehydratase [Thiobacillaceae bacterium]
MPESTPFPPPARLPRRTLDCHKGDFGIVGILGGAPGMAGAALLAGRAALLCGAGRVHVGLVDERVALDADMPELMVGGPQRAMDLPRAAHGKSSRSTSACLVVGPGLGQSAAARGLLSQALATKLPLLLDADALNLLAQDAELAQFLRHRQAPCLLTPHPGEAGRLLELDTARVQADRDGAVHALAARYGAGVVLKGHASLVLGRDGEPWRNSTGNPGMAAPGMGDVLCGIIAALNVQGLELDAAARLGVWLHGAAADAAVASGIGPVGLTASEVARTARQILNAWS